MNTDYTDCAAVYVATGKKFLDEAVQSAHSLRKQMPGLGIILHSDSSEDSSLFDQIEKIEDPQYSIIDKVHCYKNAKQQRLLFLDTDTFIAGPLYEVFDLLNRFDVVACHAPWRLSWDTETRRPWEIEGIPDAFSEPNTGVIGFRNVPKVHQAFERWKELFAQHKERGAVMHDQPAFRQCIWESGLSFYVMPPEYNCRLIFPTFINGSVKVIHARFTNMQQIAQTINTRPGNKIFDPYSKQVFFDATWKKLNRGVRKLVFRLLHS